jgi:tRNA-binding protein
MPFFLLVVSGRGTLAWPRQVGNAAGRDVPDRAPRTWHHGIFPLSPEGRMSATIEDFDRLEIRVGTVVEASPFPEARKPALRLVIDFGPTLGRKRSSAQITEHYRPDRLIGRQVCAVINFPPRQIGPFLSEVLTLGLPDEEGAVVLIRPDFTVPDGGRLF